jgi:hypothetical protein
MTDNERVAKLQGKYNRTGVLSGDEDFELEAARERVIKEQVNKRSRNKPVVTQQQVDAIARRAFAKAMHLSDHEEQALRNARDSLRTAHNHLDKIDFDSRLPQGSELESRNPETDATMPAKRAIARDLTKRLGTLIRGHDTQVALSAIDKSDRRRAGTLLPGNAFFKAAAVVHSSPENLNPVASEGRGIPGRSLDARDAGGDLGEPTRAELANLAQAGNSNAVAALMQRAMKPVVLATRP